MILVLPCDFEGNITFFAKPIDITIDYRQDSIVSSHRIMAAINEQKHTILFPDLNISVLLELIKKNYPNDDNLKKIQVEKSMYFEYKNGKNELISENYCIKFDLFKKSNLEYHIMGDLTFLNKYNFQFYAKFKKK